MRLLLFITVCLLLPVLNACTKCECAPRNDQFKVYLPTVGANALPKEALDSIKVIYFTKGFGSVVDSASFSQATTTGKAFRPVDLGNGVYSLILTNNSTVDYDMAIVDRTTGEQYKFSNFSVNYDKGKNPCNCATSRIKSFNYNGADSSSSIMPVKIIRK